MFDALDHATGSLAENLDRLPAKGLEPRVRGSAAWAKTHPNPEAGKRRSMRKQARRRGYIGFNYDCWKRVLEHLGYKCQDCGQPFADNSDICCDYAQNLTPLCRKCCGKLYRLKALLQ